MKLIDEVVIDAGHGGIDPKTGLYTTAPNKMFKHVDGTIAYEGVINMQMAKIAAYWLKKWGYKIRWTRNEDSHVDIGLRDRVIESNETWQTNLLWSIHNNASPNHNAGGSSVFTTRGFTDSDIIAQCVAHAMKVCVTETRFRYDISDHDLDIEADFYVLRKSHGAAILTETAFFDYMKDWKLLQNYKWLQKAMYVSAIGVHQGIQLANIKRGAMAA